MNSHILFRGFRKIIYNIGLVIGLLYLIYQLISSIVDLVQKGAFQINIVYTLIALIVSFFVPPILIIAWRILLQGWNMNIPLSNLVRGFSLSFLPRYIPGTIWGYLSRNEWFHQEYGVDYKTTNITNILEILVAVCSGLLVIGTVDTIRSFKYMHSVIWVIKIIGIGCFTLPVIGYKKLPAKFISEKVKVALNVVRHWILAIVFYILQWAVYGLVIFFVMKGVVTPNEPLFIVWPTLSIDYFIAWFAGLIVILVPSGIGVREFVLSSLLVSHFELMPAQAGLVSVIVRLVLSVAELFWVVIGALLVKLKVDTP